MRFITANILALGCITFSISGAHGADADFLQQEQELLKAVATAERRFGPESPKVQETLGQLSVLYKSNGREDENSMIHGRMLNIFVKNHQNWRPPLPGGPFMRVGYPGDKSEFLMPKSYLSRWLNRQLLPKYYAAKETGVDEYITSYKTALAEAEKKGARLPIAKNLEGLANVYCSQASFTQAQPLYERALTLRDRDSAFGLNEYSGLVNNLDSLAAVYSIVGKGADAERLKQRAKTLQSLRGSQSLQ